MENNELKLENVVTKLRLNPNASIVETIKHICNYLDCDCKIDKDYDLRNRIGCFMRKNNQIFFMFHLDSILELSKTDLIKLIRKGLNDSYIQSLKQ